MEKFAKTLKFMAGLALDFLGAKGIYWVILNAEEIRLRTVRADGALCAWTSRNGALEFLEIMRTEGIPGYVREWHTWNGLIRRFGELYREVAIDYKEGFDIQAIPLSNAPEKARTKKIRSAA